MRTRLLVIVFATFLLNGCSILEAINNEIGYGDVASEEGSENCEKGSTSEACSKTSVNGWANITSLSSKDIKADIVSCNVGDTIQFTTRKLCLARGGTPGGF